MWGGGGCHALRGGAVEWVLFVRLPVKDAEWGKGASRSGGRGGWEWCEGVGCVMMTATRKAVWCLPNGGGRAHQPLALALLLRCSSLCVWGAGGGVLNGGGCAHQAVAVAVAVATVGLRCSSWCFHVSPDDGDAGDGAHPPDAVHPRARAADAPQLPLAPAVSLLLLCCFGQLLASPQHRAPHLLLPHLLLLYFAHLKAPAPAAGLL